MKISNAHPDKKISPPTLFIFPTKMKKKKNQKNKTKEHHLHIIKQGSRNKVPQNAEKKQNLMKEMKRRNKNETLWVLSL
jgi:hypothetical protein